MKYQLHHTPTLKAIEFAIVEKKDENAVYALFDDKERAQNYLRDILPGYIARGFLMNKHLNASDFKIIERSYK